MKKQFLIAGLMLCLWQAVQSQDTSLPPTQDIGIHPVQHTGLPPLQDTSRFPLSDTPEAHFPDTGRLAAVVIRGGKSLTQTSAAGTIINPSGSLLTNGSSALEVLERSPGILIDHRNNGIMLNGKSGVMILLDGKPVRITQEQLIDLLSSLSADNIEKIELLTTPPAKYDAEGSAGLINIVFKKNKTPGTNGSLSLTGGYGWREKATLASTLSHTTRTGNYYASYTYTRDHTRSDLLIFSDQNMPALGGRMTVGVWDTTHLIRNSQDWMVGFDLNPAGKTRAGATIEYNYSNAAATNLNHENYHILPDSLLRYNGQILNTNQWENFLSSAYLDKEWRKNERISFHLDYLTFHNLAPSTIRSSFVNNAGTAAGNNDSLYAPDQRTAAHTTIRVGAAGVDYSRNWPDRLKLEAGLKTTLTQDYSASSIQSLVNGNWIIRGDASTTLLMNENIEAAYFSLTPQVNNKLDLVLGARYEQSQTSMHDPATGKPILNRKLGALFPSVLISWKRNNHTEWQLSYTRRISRPSYNDLASFVGYSDPAAVYTGNPFLQPTITDNIKTTLNIHAWTFTLLASRDLHPIARYQLSESPDSNLLYVSPQNLRYEENLILQTNLPLTMTPWWTMNYNLTAALNRAAIDYTQTPITHQWMSYSLNFSESFHLGHQFTAELSGWYNALSYNGTIRVDHLGAMNAGLKKELKKNRGAFQLSIADILRSEVYHLQYGALTEEAFSIKNHVQVRTESAGMPIFKLSYTRSFGTATAGSRAKKPTPATDESSRIRQD